MPSFLALLLLALAPHPRAQELVPAAGREAPVPPPGFHLVSESARVSCWSRDKRFDAGKVERRLERFERLLGARVPGRVHYYLHEHPADVYQATKRYAAGVAYPSLGIIHSIEKVHEHELVHLVSAQFGEPGLFFSEGLAVALDDGGEWGGVSAKSAARAALRKDPRLASLERLTARFEWVDENAAYPLAGSFVKRLIDRHGIQAVVRFFRDARPPAWKEPFLAAFGETADDAQAAWLKDLR